MIQEEVQSKVSGDDPRWWDIYDVRHNDSHRLVFCRGRGQLLGWLSPWRSYI